MLILHTHLPFLFLCFCFIYPCLCLCLGFSQITLITPFLLITLHLSHIFFTDGLTFISLIPFYIWLLFSSPSNSATIYSQPNQGNKYISATFTYENKKSSGNIYASIYDFDCYADNSNCEQKYIGDSSFINTNLSPGKKVTFTVYFEVPENAETIELEYKPMLQSKHIPFVIK